MFVHLVNRLTEVVKIKVSATINLFLEAGTL
jgi:hypothetical protein